MKLDYYKDIYENYYQMIIDDKTSNELSDSVKSVLFSIDNSPLTLGHAHYVIDYHLKKIIYQKGIEELLGYSDFDVDTIASYVHPDDYDRHAFIVKSVVDFFAIHTSSPLEVMFSITARVKKEDGNYINLLRNTTILDVNKKNKMTKSYSLLSDISNIKSNNQVMWNCACNGTNTEELVKFVKEKHKNIFTKKEKEILRYLQQGKNSKTISDILFVSKHTIDTHRRKMLAKSTCSNTVELLSFARNNAII